MLYRLLPTSLQRELPHEVGQFLYQYGDIALLAVAVLLLIRWSRRGRQAAMDGPALVLRMFAIDEGNADGVALRIIGRRPGMVAWILTHLGLETETTLSMNSEEISFRRASLAGQSLALVPLPNVSSTHCGHHKPLGKLIVALFFVTLAAVMGAVGSTTPALVALACAGPFFLWHWLTSRTIEIKIETIGGAEQLGLRFKPGVLDGKSVDAPKVLEAIRLINRRVVAAAEGAKRF